MDEYINKSLLLYSLIDWEMEIITSGGDKSMFDAIDKVIDKIREFPAEGACTSCPRYEAMKEGK